MASPNGSRICDANRVALGAIDASVILTSPTQPFVFAAGVNDAGDRFRPEHTMTLSARAIGGTFAEVTTASTTGPFIQTSEVLINNTAVTEANRRAGLGGIGNFIVSGKEHTSANGLNHALEVRGNHTEAQWHLQFGTSAVADRQWEFQVLWLGKDGNTTITYPAMVTTATGGGLGVERILNPTVDVPAEGVSSELNVELIRARILFFISNPVELAIQSQEIAQSENSVLLGNNLVLSEAASADDIPVLESVLGQAALVDLPSTGFSGEVGLQYEVSRLVPMIPEPFLDESLSSEPLAVGLHDLVGSLNPTTDLALGSEPLPEPEMLTAKELVSNDVLSQGLSSEDEITLIVAGRVLLVPEAVDNSSSSEDDTLNLLSRTGFLDALVDLVESDEPLPPLFLLSAKEQVSTLDAFSDGESTELSVQLIKHRAVHLVGRDPALDIGVSSESVGLAHAYTVAVGNPDNDRSTAAESVGLSRAKFLEIDASIDAANAAHATVSNLGLTVSGIVTLTGHDGLSEAASSEVAFWDNTLAPVVDLAASSEPLPPTDMELAQELEPVTVFFFPGGPSQIQWGLSSEAGVDMTVAGEVPLFPEEFLDFAEGTEPLFDMEIAQELVADTTDPAEIAQGSEAGFDSAIAQEYLVKNLADLVVSVESKATLIKAGQKIFVTNNPPTNSFSSELLHHFSLAKEMEARDAALDIGVSSEGSVGFAGAFELEGVADLSLSDSEALPTEFQVSGQVLMVPRGDLAASTSAEEAEFGVSWDLKPSSSTAAASEPELDAGLLRLSVHDVVADAPAEVEGSSELSLELDIAGQVVLLPVAVESEAESTDPVVDLETAIVFGRVADDSFALEPLPEPGIERDGFLFPREGGATPSGYSFSKELVCNSAKIPSDLTDFAAFVSIPANSDLRWDALGGKVSTLQGFDIAFFSDAELSTAVKHEKISYNAGTGAYEAWVRFNPSSTVDTSLWIAFGDDSRSTDLSDTSTTGVFAAYADGGTIGFWSHMDEDPEAATAAERDLVDATGQGNTLLSKSITPFAAAQAVGKAGDGIVFDAPFSSNAGYGHINASTHVWNASTTDFTTSIWWKSDSALGDADEQYIWGSFNNGNGFTGFFLKTDFITDSLIWEVRLSGLEVTQLGINVITDTDWHMLSASWDNTAGTYKIFVDGVLHTTFVGETMGNTGQRIGIGKPDTGRPPTKAFLDEVRMTEAVLSDDWIKAEYENQISAVPNAGDFWSSLGATVEVTVDGISSELKTLLVVDRQVLLFPRADLSASVSSEPSSPPTDLVMTLGMEPVTAFVFPGDPTFQWGLSSEADLAIHRAGFLDAVVDLVASDELLLSLFVSGQVVLVPDGADNSFSDEDADLSRTMADNPGTDLVVAAEAGFEGIGLPAIERAGFVDAVVDLVESDEQGVDLARRSPVEFFPTTPELSLSSELIFGLDRNRTLSSTDAAVSSEGGDTSTDDFPTVMQAMAPNWWWRLDEPLGETAILQYGTAGGGLGTNTGATMGADGVISDSFTSAEFLDSLDFVASDDTTTWMTDDGASTAGPADYSFGCFFNLNSFSAGGQQHLMNKEVYSEINVNDDGSLEWIRWSDVAGGTPRSITSAAGVIQLNTRHFVCCVWQRSPLPFLRGERLYVDGIEVARDDTSGANASQNLPLSRPMNLAAEEGPTGETLDGNIQHAFFFKGRGLTAVEVQALNTGGTGTPGVGDADLLRSRVLEVDADASSGSSGDGGGAAGDLDRDRGLEPVDDQSESDQSEPLNGSDGFVASINEVEGATGPVCKLEDYLSKLDIWNVTLTKLGIETLTATTDNVSQAVGLAANWEPFKKNFLRDHVWNGANTTVELVTYKDNDGVTAVEPTGPWALAYSLDPLVPEWVRSIKLNGKENRPGGKSRGGTGLWTEGVVFNDVGAGKFCLLTNEGTALLEYTFLVADNNLDSFLPADMLWAMALTFAVHMASDLGSSNADLVQLKADAEQARRDSRRTDAQSGAKFTYVDTGIADSFF